MYVYIIVHNHNTLKVRSYRMYNHNHESDKYVAVNNTWKYLILRIFMLSYTAPMF